MSENTNKTIDLKIDEEHFRVSIFGSARLKPEDKIYKMVFDLAKECGEKGYDIVTGGGPGLMEAANAGHQEGTPNADDESRSIGLTIRLPFEAEGNIHLDMRKHFEVFSKRLDHFMALSNVVVVMPGGIGTCLELFYTWQLTQVKHICSIPIIVVGDMWKELIEWIKEYPLKKGLISEQDLNNIFVVENNQKAMQIIEKAHSDYKNGDKTECRLYSKYL